MAIAIRDWLVQQLDQLCDLQLDRSRSGGDKHYMRNPKLRIQTTVLALFFIAGLLSASISTGLAQTQGSGLPLPRFVSLRASEVNLRTGPGVQYPVEWIFQRESLPVEIIKEYRTWRLVRDWEGTQGWMHQSMLSGKRTFLVTGKERTIRAQPEVKSRAVAIAEINAIGELLSCPGSTGWCQVRVKGVEGWLRRVEFWGAYRNESFE